LLLCNEDAAKDNMVQRFKRLVQSALPAATDGTDKLAREVHDAQGEFNASASLREADAIHTPRASRPPHAETGINPAVVLKADGTLSDDLQDAMRTTAETRPIHAAEQPYAMSTSPVALIIEDTPDLADLLEVTLQRMGLTAVIAARGSQAVTRLDELMPDVVLLDIHLPDMTGWQVLEAIKERSRREGAHSPAVIVITAYGDAANRLVGKLQGVHQYLVKPLQPNEIETVVRNALSAVRKA
jgi:CheY-like chemotaxis protein